MYLKLTPESAKRLEDAGGFLGAWEVMDNYRINSAQQRFGRPAIDFLWAPCQRHCLARRLTPRPQRA